MEHSQSWEANTSSASQETPCTSSPHSQQPFTCPCPEPDKSSPCFSHPTSRRSTLILSSYLRLALPSGRVLSPELYMHLSFPHVCYMFCHLSYLDLITRILFGVECRAYSSFLCCLLHSSVTSSLIGQHFLNTLFSQTLSLRSSLNVRDQV